MVFIGPAVLFLLLFIVYPIGFSLYISFHDFFLVSPRPPSFVAHHQVDSVTLDGFDDRPRLARALAERLFDQDVLAGRRCRLDEGPMRHRRRADVDRVEIGAVGQALGAVGAREVGKALEEAAERLRIAFGPEARALAAEREQTSTWR